MNSFKSILEKTIFFGLLATLLIAPTQYSFVILEKTHLSIVDPLIWVLCLAWIVLLIRSGDLQSIRFPPLLSVVFILVTGISICRPCNVMAGLKDLFQLIEYFVVTFLLFAAMGQNERRRRMIAGTLLASATAVIIYGVVQYFSPSVDAFNVRSTFGNRNTLGGYMSLMLPLALGVALFSRSWVKRAWLALLILLGLAITMSGACMIALLVAFAMVAMLKGPRAFLLVAAALIMFSLIIIPQLPRDNEEILVDSVSLYDSDREVNMRYTEWQAATIMLQENPVLGVGVGNYQENIRTYWGSLPDRPVVVEHDSQNLYLVIAASTGLVGLVCFLGMFVFFLLHAFRGALLIQGNERGLAVGLFGSVIAFMINCIWSPLLVRGIGVPLAVVLALAMLLGERVQDGGMREISSRNR